MSSIAHKMPTSYEQARRMLSTPSGYPLTYKKIAHNTTLHHRDDRTIGLVYHATEIVTFDVSNKVTLNTGGWRTATTKDRLNGVLFGSDYRVQQVRYVWQVRNVRTGETFPFEDGDTWPLG